MMKKAVLMCCFCWLFASEDVLDERYNPKDLQLSKEEKAILQESQKSLEAQNPQDTKTQPVRVQGATEFQNQANASSNANPNPSTEQKKAGTPKVDAIAQPNKDSVQKNSVDVPPPQEEKKWVYGTAVLTTTFLDGSIKRGYAILLKDGLYLTSANMVYNSAFYTRSIDAMMQDESAIPFVCVAKLFIKALDLQRGLAILSISDYTDAYCNPRPRSPHHQRIQDQSWIDVFNTSDVKPREIYTPYITSVNSFLAQKVDLGSEKLEDFIKKPTKDFEMQTHPYGKGFYTRDGKLLGVIASDGDNKPKWIKTQEVAEFLCELSEKKIIETPYLQSKCQTR